MSWSEHNVLCFAAGAILAGIMVSPRQVFSFEWFARREEHAADQYDKLQWRVSEERSKFFERLALLSGSAVVLSVSLLSTVFGRATIHAIALLFGGWFALVLSLVASLFRELRYQPYLLQTSMSHYQFALANKKAFLASKAAAGEPVIQEPQRDGSIRPKTTKELTTEADDARKDASSREAAAERLFNQMQRMEGIAIHSFWLGVLFLAMFAGINVVRGVGHYYFR